MKFKTETSLSNHSPSKRSPSGDSFSFPSTPNQEDSDFEFGSLTPNSPSCTTSPADQIFFNGRLQPHSFPLNHVTTSRTSSKDSLLSSRSNSTNSSCSSARTSSSDSSERKLFHNRSKLSSRSVSRPVQQSHGCSQRRQYITPVPVALNRDASKRRKQKRAKREAKKKMKKRVSLRFVRRILGWFFIACRQCHAMEPSKAQNKGINNSCITDA
ncbi:hypothetical protein L195_g023852 [Trifolium pratense]|uniref:Uncharacterized protein n=2 Tax=Trifolium pratense TaxID=57577 RepID=A0A2K3NC10_TRIPR|nr:uncharacterized protein LOC123895302 [Trifolium pratense]PNY00569.1 hypothetical protein L195_g023852 [Trifolium pratense]CAJ2645463.1 unnamed protein product [Trifolium pratense]